MIVRTKHRMMGLILVVLLAASACGGSTAPAAENLERSEEHTSELQSH